jgi:hypothetical protein
VANEIGLIDLNDSLARAQADKTSTCMMEYPALVSAVSMFALWLAAKAGAYFCRKRGKMEEDERVDLGVVVTAALTLLGLIIGFTFSMAITRYDQRKDYEAAEANAIGTQFARAGLLPAADAARLRALLKDYLNQRVLFYTTRSKRRLQQINISTAKLQEDLWSAVQDHATAQPTPIAALAVSGMNDVLNSQAYTQAAWWNRIPIAAWFLMASIAIYCDYLIGYTTRRPEGNGKRFFVLPLIVSTSFFLIADIDSPRGGVIRVHPHNLESVFRSASNVSNSAERAGHSTRFTDAGSKDSHSPGSARFLSERNDKPTVNAGTGSVSKNR